MAANPDPSRAPKGPLQGGSPASLADPMHGAQRGPAGLRSPFHERPDARQNKLGLAGNARGKGGTVGGNRRPPPTLAALGSMPRPPTMASFLLSQQRTDWRKLLEHCAATDHQWGWGGEPPAPAGLGRGGAPGGGCRRASAGRLRPPLSCGCCSTAVHTGRGGGCGSGRQPGCARWTAALVEAAHREAEQATCATASGALVACCLAPLASKPAGLAGTNGSQQRVPRWATGWPPSPIGAQCPLGRACSGGCRRAAAGRLHPALPQRLWQHCTGTGRLLHGEQRQLGAVAAVQRCGRGRGEGRTTAGGARATAPGRSGLNLATCLPPLRVQPASLAGIRASSGHAPLLPVGHPHRRHPCPPAPIWHLWRAPRLTSPSSWTATPPPLPCIPHRSAQVHPRPTGRSTPRQAVPSRP